jgi:hypothetical protein
MTDAGMPGDLGMAVAYAVAQTFGPPPALPASLHPIDARVAVVAAIDRPFLEDGLVCDASGALLANQQRFIDQRLREIASASASGVPDVPDNTERLKICLRLWSGCLSAAKEMREFDANRTPYTKETRAESFRAIDTIAHSDPIYAAGVEAAPGFVRKRGQRCYTDGIPDTSCVRRYL